MILPVHSMLCLISMCLPYLSVCEQDNTYACSFDEVKKGCLGVPEPGLVCQGFNVHNTNMVQVFEGNKSVHRQLCASIGCGLIKYVYMYACKPSEDPGIFCIHRL